MTADQLIVRLDGLRKNKRGWTARCPAHDDRANSLSVALGDDGRLLVNCFARCRPQAIVEALGLELADLFADGSRGRHAGRRRQAPALTPLDEARREVLQEGRRQRGRLAPYLNTYRDADLHRGLTQVAAGAQDVATLLGDTGEAWQLVDVAAALQREAFSLEAELDERLAEGRRWP